MVDLKYEIILMLGLTLLVLCMIVVFIFLKYFNDKKKVLIKLNIKDTYGLMNNKKMGSFKILDLWELKISGQENFNRVEVFLEHKGVFYEYSAMWNIDIEPNRKKSPIVNSNLRQSEYLSILQWEESKHLGV
jgi:hypothetical protein